MKSIYRAHPWHGVSLGNKAPEVLTAYIEFVSGDTIKYELDKQSGILKIDRPQRYSNIFPALYGMLPQTYSGSKVAAICMRETNRDNISGDGDPLDICVLTEKIIPRGDILLTAIPIGGFRMLDKGQADDKILAVLKDDALFGKWSEITDVPETLLTRLRHYFLTYKLNPELTRYTTEIIGTYNRLEAYEIIKASQVDYTEKFG